MEKKLFSLYIGINEVFNCYCEYIEEINDDSFLKRGLESIKRKNEIFQIQLIKFL